LADAKGIIICVRKMKMVFVILKKIDVKVAICIIFLIAYHLSRAQSDDVLNRALPEITVADSLVLDVSKNESISRLHPLTFSQQDFVESLFSEGIVLNAYGPGQLSTLNIRGTYGYMNRMLWEGISINNDLVGQSDISTIIPFATDAISVVHGGTGNGTTGSEVNIRQIQSRSKIDQWKWGGKAGQFNTYGSYGGWQYGKQNLQSNTYINLLRSKNNFSYLDNGFKRIRDGGLVQQAGIKHAMDYQWGQGNEMGYRIWVQSSFRQIPSPIPALYNGAKQTDLSKRVLYYWKKIYNRDEWTYKTAFFDQSLNYNDSTVLINFEGRALKFVNRINYTHYWNPFSKFETSFQYDFIKASSTGFTKNKIDHQWQFKVRYSKEWPSEQLFTSAFASQRYAFGNLYGTTYGSQMTWHPLKRWSTELVLDKYLTIPSFNDLYWVPGGNSTLLATTGWGGHLNLMYSFDIPAHIVVETYQKSIHDQIQWLPVNAFFTAINVPFVWSRGLIISSSFEGKVPFRYKLRAHFERTLSTYESQRLPNDNALGKQLIYIPKNQALLDLELRIKGWDIKFNNRWVSKRYTTSDNSAFLDSYNLLNMYILKKIFITRKIELEVITSMLNVLNKQYALQYAWPMPGRQLNIEFIFNLNKN